jgi:hypothetical protein
LEVGCSRVGAELIDVLGYLTAVAGCRVKA